MNKRKVLIEEDSVRKGVDDAVSFWFYDSCITSRQCFEAGVADAVTKWLDKNKDEIIEKWTTKHGIQGSEKTSS